MNISKDDVYAETNRLAFLATTAIERAMNRLGLRRSDVADRLGLPRSRVTKVLDGEENLTLKTLASFGLACGVRWHFGASALADGGVALDWNSFEFVSKCGGTEEMESAGAYSLEVQGVDYREPGTCSAQRASQEPPGPL